MGRIGVVYLVDHEGRRVAYRWAQRLEVASDTHDDAHLNFTSATATATACEADGAGGAKSAKHRSTVECTCHVQVVFGRGAYKTLAQRTGEIALDTRFATSAHCLIP